ncbi:hypothetical protein CH359_19295 [Leptospira meyeri]|nr:hypothetical protein CH359_19295 [Leptospira meyeri]PJZ95006.1 hypothetical protein CH358_19415 [Leptospira meyeri]
MKFSSEQNAKILILADIFFILAPLFIFFIIKITSDNLEGFLKSPDISYVNMILFGQSIIRFVSGITKSKKNLSWQLIALIITLILVFGLFPSATILILTLISPFSSNFVIPQWLLFFLAISCYFVIGSVGQILLDE